MSYSDALLEHFYRPRNNRVMRDADAVGVAGIPGNGPFMVVYLRLEGDRIQEAAFQTHGCAPSVAAGSVLATALPGTLLQEACERWSADVIDTALGGVPAHKRHCPALAAAALAAACRSRIEAQAKVRPTSDPGAPSADGHVGWAGETRPPAT